MVRDGPIERRTVHRAYRVYPPLYIYSGSVGLTMKISETHTQNIHMCRLVNLVYAYAYAYTHSHPSHVSMRNRLLPAQQCAAQQARESSTSESFVYGPS